uniref:Terminase n=1 Tax=uncultured marine virus TaxID=186617 RepID=A0A0F7L718_9VIRU|nr:terminase [uncultured marine virus]
MSFENRIPPGVFPSPVRSCWNALHFGHGTNQPRLSPSNRCFSMYDSPFSVGVDISRTFEPI